MYQPPWAHGLAREGAHLQSKRPQEASPVCCQCKTSEKGEGGGADGPGGSLTWSFSNVNRVYITLPTKVHLVKAMVFPVVMYGCESWTLKKAEH